MFARIFPEVKRKAKRFKLAASIRKFDNTLRSSWEAPVPVLTWPCAAVKIANISAWSPDTKRRNLEEVRLDVIIDSVMGGRESYISAARGFLCFVKNMHPHRISLPPQVGDLILWPSFFGDAGLFHLLRCSQVDNRRVWSNS
jgi:hypothetical protein